MRLTAYALQGIVSAVAWEVEVVDEVGDWYAQLDEVDTDAVNAAVEMLEELGPGLGRPVVDSVKGSRLHNLKELIPPGTNIRILFIFDPRRTAILLVGGDKAGRWKEWYEEAIPIAEAKYEEYLAELKQEGLLT